MTPVADAVATFTAPINYSGPPNRLTNLCCSGTTRAEAYSLYSLLCYVFPSKAAIEPEDAQDFSLEAKVATVLPGSLLDMNEESSTQFRIEVRPSRGRIANLKYAGAHAAGSNGESATVIYEGKEFFKGYHVVTIFYNPAETG